MRKKKFPKKTYWVLTIVSVLFGILYSFGWSTLIGHSREFELYFFHLLIFSIPSLIFLLIIVRRINSKSASNLKDDERKSLMHMGVLSLIFGSLIFLPFIALIVLESLFSWVFIMPLVSPVLLILIGILLIRYSKQD